MLRPIPSILALVAALTIAGCDRHDHPHPHEKSDATAAKKSHGDDGHEHVAAHGGVITDLGVAHAELAEAPQLALALYVLGVDESVAEPIDATTLTGQLQKRGTAEFVEVVFQAQPLPGEAPKSSRFISAPNQFERGSSYDLTMYLPIGGKNHRARFVAFGESHDGGHGAAHGAMEARNVGAPAERTPKITELWFTPKGKYTAADIAANGERTAYEKYGEVEVEHEDPTPGEVVCPISKSKTNPAITWQIDGKTYSFCCPPCIEDMVQRAKEKPDTILAPEQYVKK